MMAQSASCILLVAALLTTSTQCSAENVYCVTPTPTSCSSCPHNSTNCTTLSEYAQEAELYFTSNTTMVFLPGDHVLDTNITVTNVARFTMHGKSSSSNVVCDGLVGFSFTGMVNFKIHSLAFNSCSRKYALPPVSNYALLLQSTQHSELVNCSFHGNLGTAFVVINANITLAGNTEFTHNHCTESNSCVEGGGIAALSSNLTFTGNTIFLENMANSHSGGAINAPDKSMLTFHGNSLFINNSAENGRGGAIYASKHTVLSFNGVSNFTNNSARNNRGGAIYTSYDTVLSFNGISTFINNSACSNRGGAIYTSDSTTLNFNGSTKFANNLAVHGGAIYSSENTVLHFSGTSKFISNSATVYGGAIRAGGNSKLIFNGTISFTNNGPNKSTQTGDVSYGGGVNMGQKCTFSILPNTTVYWANNHATFGGAIYIQDGSPLSYCTVIATYISEEPCFFQLPGQNLSNGTDVKLVFKNNSADAAGSVLYGGVIDNCKLSGLESNSSGKVFDMIVHIEDDTDYNPSSFISSDPLYICPCEHNLQNCNKSQYYVPYSVYPGETWQVSVVVAGQRDGALPGAVSSKVSKTRNTASPGNLQGYQYLQQVNKTCTKLDYTVFSLSPSVNIVLQAADSSCYEFTLDIAVKINQTCPPGFNISESARSCVCEPRLAKYTGTHQCTIENGLGQITRDSSQQFWVGYDCQSDGLILHPHCPFDYCTSKTVNFSLNNTDIQCAQDRSGPLCGDCKEGYSLVLGTSQCKQCTNNYLILLIPFAVMGIVLVFFLNVCKLTVATGMLSGLVFYANIIGANHTTFLHKESTELFSVFIAWLNLDFGIETCFYNGMDAYTKTWLQFVFPVYLWVIVGIMIFASNFSRRFAKLLGNNPVSVLATIILLSYTKILRTLITVIYITYLEYPAYNRGVWLYDANIDYLSGKHIPLFLVAVLVFLFLFLPYTLLLLFGQWLQTISHLRLFSWVNSARLKPFMDSYHAPYKAKHRYWPGLLLMFRFVLFLVFALNPSQDPSINLLAILVGTGILVVWAWVCGGVYRNWCLGALEGSFALNLIILAVATYHVEHSKGNQLAVGYTSVSIALVTFIGIVAYHTLVQLRYIKLLKKPNLNFWFNRKDIKQPANISNNQMGNSTMEEADFDQLRESLLDDQPQPSYGAF